MRWIERLRLVQYQQHKRYDRRDPHRLLSQMNNFLLDVQKTNILHVQLNSTIVYVIKWI